MIVCQQCGRGGGTHCVSCHRSFSGQVAFDAHRRGLFTDGGRYCVPVDTAEGWWVNRRGEWSHGERDRRWSA
jgi:hypothetical protein